MKMDSIIHKRSFRLRRTPLYDRKYKKHNTFHYLLAYHVPLAVAVPGAAVGGACARGWGVDCCHLKKVSSRLRKTPTSRNYVEKPYAKPSLLEAMWSGRAPAHQKKMRFVRVKRH